MSGPVTLALLGLAALAVGVCAASWGFARRPTEATLTAGTVAVAYLFVPVYTLGWLGLLGRGVLLGALSMLALAIVGGTIARPTARARAALALRSIMRFVAIAPTRDLRAPTVGLLGAIALVAMCAWTGGLTVLAPSDSWDGLLYHEAMVGTALQRGGFEWLGWETSQPHLAHIDSFPRLVESLALVCVVAWDRRVIELAPSFLLLLFYVGAYASLRRVVASRHLARALAVAMALLPTLVFQLRSTLVDVGYAALFAASVAWVLRRRLDAPSVWVGGLSIGLLAASKMTALFAAPVLGLVLAGRVLLAARPLRGHLAAVTVLALALSVPIYARNIARTGNPLWPARVDVAALDLHLPGPLDTVDMNVSFEQGLARVYGPPIPGPKSPGVRFIGYGHAAPFVIPPLALLGLGLAIRRAGAGTLREEARRLLAVCVPSVLYLAVSPAWHWARHNLHVVIGMFLLAAYWAGQRGRERLAHGLAGAMILVGLLTIAWSGPAWGLSVETALRLAALDPRERAVADRPVDGRVAMPRAVARARERELGPGDIVVFERVHLIGGLWNERFDNVVEHLDSGGRTPAAWIAEARRRRAEWVVVPSGGPLEQALRADPRFEAVGSILRDRPDAEVAFRRLR